MIIIKKNTFKGPNRRTYYDMDPWYLKNKDTGIFDWHQQIEEVNKFILEKIRNLIENNGIKNILEAACGGGDFTLKYASLDISVDAFESSHFARIENLSISDWSIAG